MGGWIPAALQLPMVEHRLQRLLADTRAMNGLVVISEARYGLSLERSQEPDPVESIRFVPFAKIAGFNSVLRRRPGGGALAERICSLLLEHYGSTAKPVLLLRHLGDDWLGMVPFSREASERDHRLEHLWRCWSA
jgi:hypothetical protein